MLALVAWAAAAQAQPANNAAATAMILEAPLAVYPPANAVASALLLEAPLAIYPPSNAVVTAALLEMPLVLGIGGSAGGPMLIAPW